MPWCWAPAGRRTEPDLREGTERLARLRGLGRGLGGPEVFRVRLHEPQLAGRARRAGRRRQRFTTGDADQGQPTHFLPRRNRFIFRVPVPAGFTEKDEMVWALTTRGKTEQAFASLRLDYKIDDVVKASKPARSAPAAAVPRCAPTRRQCSKCRARGASRCASASRCRWSSVVRDDGIPKARADRRGRRGRERRSSPTCRPPTARRSRRCAPGD